MHFKKWLSVTAKKPNVFISLGRLPRCSAHVLEPLRCTQPTRYFHLNSRQYSFFQVTRWTNINIHLSLPAQQCTRTFCSSPIVSASSSTINSVTKGPPTDATLSVFTDNAKHAVPQTNTEAALQQGLDEIANPGNGIASTAPLLFPDFPTIQAAEQTIQKLHDVTGLPWWATITLCAVSLRLFLILPLSVYALHNAEKLNRLQPEIVEISKRLKKEVSMAMHQFKWNEKKAKDEYIKNMKRLLRDLHIRDNCHPLKTTASFWLQFPLWISISYSLRNMTSRAINPALDHHEEFKALTDQGTLWFSDLTMVDSTWILPVLMGFVTLFNIEMTHLKIAEETKYRQRLTLFLRCLALLFIPISSTMPSAMVFYWVNSGFLAAGQNILHDHLRFRRLVGLGPSQTESSSPVKALLIRAKQKYFER
ncbi:mitochondrial inner membrane protein COX18 [Elysia marginata]|uniref:Mitochondrial inner membrane protein COX18 n=1 Tax=Elysia marginata TaxID=1093978 RepID=A0AAV4JNC4_9GAST|nr:mitochondrial inner membrane protein COX18 [Elysia marginata]